MKSIAKTFVATLLFLGLHHASFSQDFQILKTITGDDTHSFALTQSERKDFGFAVISSGGQVQWTLNVPGKPIGLSKFGKDVVIIYAEITKNFEINVIHSALVDLSSRKMSKDKVIYTNPGKTTIEPFVLNIPDDRFGCVLVRETLYTPGGFGGGTNSEGKMAATRALTKITLTRDMVPQEKAISTIATESIFMISCTGANQDIYIGSTADDQLVVERVDSAGNTVAKLSAALPIKSKSRTFQIASADRTQPGCVDLAISYLNPDKIDQVQVFRFDFDKKKAIVSEQVALNKEYVRSLRADKDESKLRTFREVNSLQGRQIIETPENIIVVKEVAYRNLDKNSWSFRTMGSIISVYTKNLKLLREVVIDKWSENYIFEFPAISTHLNGDKLYAVTNEKQGFGFKTELYVINIADGSMTNQKIVDPESGMNWLTMPANVMWYNSGYVIPFTKAKAFINLEFDTRFVAGKF